jgi:hypothetical protein
MNSFIFYRISSYFLLIIAIILGLVALLGLLIALSNPSLLLRVFVIVAVVIYSIASFQFLLNGIDGKRQLQPKFRDLIKVNAYVTIVFVMVLIIDSFITLNTPSAFTDVVNQMPVSKQSKTQFSAAFMIRMMKAIIWFIIFYAIVLGFHIMQTFQYLKQYAHLFAEKKNNNSAGDSF